MSISSLHRSIPSRMKQYGTSYYYATLFFPRKLQQSVMTLYAFVRIPDLVVDQKNANDIEAYETLTSMRAQREHAYTSLNTQDPTW
jgi:phytoene/squalene synthetase